jgi:hypothetical protein
MKAKVFLSCGQSKGSNEPVIAERIAQRIRDDYGFDCYIAVAEQTLLGLRENIFTQLQTADYLIFIDFKREELKTGGAESVHRGSLFSHQELAIASFLEIPALVLQERGVKQLDGMLGVMQANACEFSDRDQLPDIISGLISTKVREGQWHNQSGNQLTLNIVPKFVDAQSNGVVRRYYHIAVWNPHHRKAALNCFAYLDEIVNLGTGEEIRPETIELKWAGTLLSNVRIGSQSYRKLDAFWLPHRPPLTPGFNVLSDSTAYLFNIGKPGKHRLTYSVVSQNFAPVSKSFILEFGTNLDVAKFGEA